MAKFSRNLLNVALAQSYDLNSAAQQLAAGSPISTPEKIFSILKTVIQYTYTIFFITAVFFILIAAFNFLTAKGDPAKIVNARQQIFWAIIAIVIALLSVGAASIISNFVKGA
ncbi:MAG: hypothetical protein WC461_01360 [Candidatus Paceibacterota bacterium]